MLLGLSPSNSMQPLHISTEKSFPPIITPLCVGSKLLLLSQCSICLQIRKDAADKKEHLFKQMGRIDLLCRSSVTIITCESWVPFT